MFKLKILVVVVVCSNAVVVSNCDTKKTMYLLLSSICLTIFKKITSVLLLGNIRKTDSF